MVNSVFQCVFPDGEAQGGVVAQERVSALLVCLASWCADASKLGNKRETGEWGG